MATYDGAIDAGNVTGAAARFTVDADDPATTALVIGYGNRWMLYGPDDTVVRKV